MATTTKARKGASRVEFVSDAPDSIDVRVSRDDENADLLNLKIRSLDIGREGHAQSEMSSERAVASVMTVIALTWAT
jgi:hypothetical protein